MSRVISIDGFDTSAYLADNTIERQDIVIPNKYGANYTYGKPFPPERWVKIIQLYKATIHNDGRCSARSLAKKAKISRQSAKKAIDAYVTNGSIPKPKMCGHGRHGPGSIIGFSLCHHDYIYQLYLDNPSRPLQGYVEEFKKNYGSLLSKDLFQRWFKNAGPYKGSMRATSRFPSGRNSASTIDKLREYLEIIRHVRDHRYLVFADEKPMKEINIYRNVRRDPRSGLIPNHEMEANSKNRFNILAAVTIKPGVRPVCFKVIEACTDADMFLQFVKYLLMQETLQPNDIFIVDNCTVHMQGNNVGLQDSLMNDHGILMIPLPPYHPDFNPTELVFNTLLQRLTAERARYKSLDAYDFLDAILLELCKFTRLDVISFYQKCGYYY